MAQKNVSFFLIILFFAGSMVVIAAHQLKRQHQKMALGTSDDARRFIQALQGDILSRTKEGYIDPEAVPKRKQGQLLLPEDRKRLHKFLGGIVPSASEE